ncbi:MAG: hypothetical protein PHG08_00340 [Bacilli bacterium]|nr:hypothetical protein [Bacilli bacterium]
METEDKKTPEFEVAGIVETLKATGSLRIQHYDKDGKLKEDRIVPNLVVDVGKAFIAGRIAASPTPPTAISHMEVGTSAAGLGVGNTVLASPVVGSRTALTSATSGVPAANKIRFICTFGTGVGTGALVEAGLFNGSPSGTMLCRTTFDVINKGAADSITITWDLTIS